jgi:organic radical activating enzyme
LNIVASGHKVAYHKEKLTAYLEQKPIFPVTLEMDITSQCSRVCKDCPSSRSPYQKSLSWDFIQKLFASFEGQTKGLLLTGGEPTISPLFPEVLAFARKSGFEDIAVVTNGSHLQKQSVADALVQDASTIRLSMYDWDGDSCHGIQPTLKKIEHLRNRIDLSGSALKIGISALTSFDRVPRLSEIAESVLSAGAHWIYFHPMCTGWNNAHLAQVNQDGVLNAIQEYRNRCPDNFDVFVSHARYDKTPLEFSSYHAAHFLLVIGADGKNYLGAEVKYQENYIVDDIAGRWSNDFLQRPERLAKINAVNSMNYTALHSRHRGVLYNDYIEKMKSGPAKTAVTDTYHQINKIFFPNIL